jgi:hypothetical protein
MASGEPLLPNRFFLKNQRVTCLTSSSSVNGCIQLEWDRCTAYTPAGTRRPISISKKSFEQSAREVDKLGGARYTQQEHSAEQIGCAPGVVYQEDRFDRHLPGAYATAS